MQDKDSFNRGMDLFRRGVLSEAALAFEAEVQRNPDNVEAWRLLGTVHAENEEDQLVPPLSSSFPAGHRGLYR